MTDTFKCERRDEIGVNYPGLPTEDRWDMRSGHRVCSYCGSCHPDDFFAAVDKGAKVTPTDKGYKAYIDLPEHSHAKFYFQHLSHEDKEKFIRYMNEKRFNLAFPGYFYSRPYFVQYRKSGE